MLGQVGLLSVSEKMATHFHKKMLAIFSFAAISFLCGTASATPFTWTDKIDTNYFISQGGAYSYTHDLTQGNIPPFVPGQDSITGYTLTLRLFDDNVGSWECLPEIAYVDLPGLISDGIYSFSKTNNEFGWSFAGFFSLNTTGKFKVTITSLLGDFYFDYSILTAKGYNNSAPVPEPASIILFGTGLIVLGFTGRKFKVS